MQKLSISDLLDPEKMKAFNDQFRDPTPEQMAKDQKSIKSFKKRHKEE